MQGVTTAIVAFLLVCIIFPHLVKNRPQYYAALTAILVVILLDGLARMIDSHSFAVFAYLVTGVLQVCSLILLLLCAGGIGVRQLAGEMAHAYEVIRRGETEKTVIIPITGQMPAPRPPVARPQDKEDDSPTVYRIDPPAPSGGGQGLDSSAST